MGNDLSIKPIAHKKAESYQPQEYIINDVLYTKNSRVFDGHYKIFAAEDNGTMYFQDKNTKKTTLWQDTDKNGKYDTKSVMTSDCKFESIFKLNEKENDIKTVQDKVLNEILDEDKKYQLSKLDINGKIEDSRQGKVGDCWLLSGLNALSETTNGAKLIKNSISQNKETGNVTVTFKSFVSGDKVSYTFTPKQINEAESRLSRGDDDVRVIEMGIEQMRLDAYSILKDERIKSLSNSGINNELFLLMAGEEGKNCTPNPQVKQPKNMADKISAYFFGLKKEDECLDEILNQKQKDPKRYAVVASYFHNPERDTVLHQYCVKKVNNNSVTVSNPWGSGIDIKMPRQRFDERCKYISSLDTKYLPSSDTK